MKTARKGMRVDEQDWQAFLGRLHAALDHFGVAGGNRAALVSFVESTKDEIVERSK